MTKLERARKLFAELEPSERREIFVEFAQCACKTISEAAVKLPVGAKVGMAVGGLLGAFLSPPPTSLTMRGLMPVNRCPDCGCTDGMHYSYCPRKP